METLTAKFKVVTPLFLAGADQAKAELRAPSIKAAMRFWYRAVDPNYNNPVDPSKSDSPTWEQYIFGSAEHGQGRFSLRSTPLEKEIARALRKRDDYLPLNEKNDKSTIYHLNGFLYMGYPFFLKGNGNRTYIPPNTTFTVTICFKSTVDNNVKRAVLASLWLLGHVGGLGSRSRRGFGTVALQSWEGLDVEGLSPAHGATSAEDWMTSFQEGLTKIKSWFPGFKSEDHSVFGANTMLHLFVTGCIAGTKEATIIKDGRDKKVSGYFTAWECALAEAGKVMQQFRFHREPDYSLVKENPLGGTPKRVHFGLPLTFRPRGATPITFEGSTHNRSASPIHLRVVEIGNACHPLYMRMNAPLLASDEMLKQGLNPGASDVLDNFWTELCKQPGCSIAWEDTK